MGSLSGCGKALGISAAEQKVIRAIAEEFKADGYDGPTSIMKAVEQQLAQLREERGLIVGRIRAAVGEKQAEVKVEVKPTAAIKDFGVKIGGARKDTAESGKPKPATRKATDDAEPWRKAFVVLEKVDGSGWVVGKKGDTFGLSSSRAQVFPTEEAAEEAIPLYAVAQKHSVYSNGDGTYSIFKKVSDRKRFKMVNKDFASREEGMTYMAQHAVEILNTKTTFGEEILPTPDNAQRSGKSFRGAFMHSVIDRANADAEYLSDLFISDSLPSEADGLSDIPLSAESLFSLASEMDTNLNKSTSYRTAVSSKFLRNLYDRNPLFVQDFSLLSAPQRRLMLSAMLSLGHDAKIVDRIVKFIPVDVMDLLGRENLSVKMLFHDPSVFSDFDAINVNPPVGPKNIAISHFIGSVARMAAKGEFEDFARISLEKDPAINALDLDFLHGLTPSVNVTPEDFIRIFNPRSIEFGNWNNQEERQQVMNHAFDGLMDLANVLGIPPKALMLDGELAIAFGARGQGLSGAKAHYERNYGVINLTKMSGAGSLAHELAHAFDHYLGRLDGKAKSERVKNERGDLVFPAKSKSDDYLSYSTSAKSKARPELVAAWRELIEGMYRKAEQYVEDTKRADDFVATSRNHLAETLQRIRDDIAADQTHYAKSKGGYRASEKGLRPASAEQLAEFDRLASILLEGGDLDTKWQPTNPDAKVGPAAFAGRHTNSTLESISAIYKDIRGRSGFNKESGGPLDRVRAAMRTYGDRLKMLADASAGTEKTKKVATNYAIEAKKMDQARTGDYWGEPTEMLARAFAAYVEDKIAEQGNKSEFLVYHAHGGILLPMIDGFIARPYPEGKERQAINAAFDTFFQVLETKETDKGVALYSQSAEPAQNAHESAASLIDAFKTFLNWTALEATGFFHVVQTGSQLPDGVNQTGTRGVVTRAGHVYFVADQISKGQERGVALHEIGVHYGMQGFLGADKFAVLLRQVENMRANSKNIQAAFDLVPGDTPAAARTEEALGYLIEVNPKHRLVQRLLSAIKTFLFEHGFMDAKHLTENDLVTLAEGALRRVVKQAAQDGRTATGRELAGAMTSREQAVYEKEYREVESKYWNEDGSEKPGAMLSPNGEKSRLNKRQWIQVRTPSFKRWFGDWQNQNISDKADAQMIAWSNGELKASDIIRFGNTSHILQQFGFPDLPVEMAQSVLKKAVNKKHNVEIGDLKGLGTALQYPLAILKSKHGPEHRVLLTKLRHKDGNIVVAVELNATQMGFEVSDITSVHPKRDESVMRWVFEDNLLVAYDKSKGREWLEDSARSNSSQPQDITTLDDYSMYDVEGFVNTSKVVDSNGEPLVVYHGTASDFTVFDASKAGKHFNDPTGFYFTNNTSHSTGRRDGKLEVYNDMTSAGAYAKNANVMMDDKGAPNIMPVFVNLKNPLIITEDSDGRGVLSLIESRTRGAGYALQEAQAEGHDGIVVTDTGMTFESTGQNETVVAATDPNQIKSATGNTGAFSLETDDIRYSSAPAAAVEATRAALAEAKSYFTDSTPGELAQGLARMLNPFDWSRLRQNFETITPDPVKDAMGWLFGNPVFQAERDPDKRAFVDAGIAREENKIGFDLRFMGWDGHSDKKSTFLSRLKSTYTQWGDSDKSTAWGRIQDQNRKLSSADQQAVNVLLVEGDRRSKVYSTLEKALLNKTVAAAKPSAAAFAVYKSVRRHIDTVVAREREKIFTEMSRKAGMDEEAIKRHISDYRQTLSERPGWLPRNHGDGKHQVNVYQIIKELKFEVKSVNTEGHGDNSSQAYLPYYAGPQATEKLTALVGKINEKYGAAEETRNKRLKFGAFINGTALTANGQLIVTGSKQDVAEFVQRAQAVLPEVIEENIQNLEDLKGERIKKQEQGAGEADLKELDALIEAAGDTRVKVKVFMQLHNSKAAAQKVLKAVKSDLKTAMPVNYRGDAVYEIPEVTTAGGMSESSFGDLMGDFAMERAQIETINRMMKSGEISKEEYKKLRENIIKAAAEVLMGRGAGRHQIQRAPYLIEGYETENAIGLYHDYMTATAGMLSKAEYAKQQFDNFRNAPNAVKPWAEAYIRYNLRNMGLADRISGNARAVATFWYLGFKVSSILINGTQVWTLGVAELGRRTKQNAVKAIARAQGDIMRGKLSAEEQELFDSKIWKLQEMETAVHEISGSGEGVTGTISENFHQLVNKAMMPFQEMELLNRRTMILAAYRSALADGMAKAEAVEFALDVNRKTNFEMSRANLPGWAQNPMGRTAYALQSFVWNNWNWIYNRATSGEKADMLALLKYAAMLSAIGGVAALAGGDEADKLLRRFTGKSYKLELEKWTRRHAREYGTAGELLNAMVWHGGVGALGVNVSNAMRLNIPMSGFITGDKGAGESAMGVFAGLADKASRTAQFASQGQYARALESAAPTAVESPLRALRMVTKGATTAHGKQIFDEQGQPVKYSAVEGIGRGLGFQPLEQSRRMEAAMATNKAVTYWNEKRGDLLDQLRLAGNGPDRRVVMDEIKAFNRKVKDSQAWPKVNIISFESIRRSEQVKPDRKKQAAMRNNI